MMTFHGVGIGFFFWNYTISFPGTVAWGKFIIRKFAYSLALTALKKIRLGKI